MMYLRHPNTFDTIRIEFRNRHREVNLLIVEFGIILILIICHLLIIIIASTCIVLYANILALDFL